MTRYIKSSAARVPTSDRVRAALRRERVATIGVLAISIGVSTGTVSRVLRDAPWAMALDETGPGRRMARYAWKETL